MKLKTLFIIALTITFNFSQAQIKLKDDSIHPAQKDQNMSATNYQNLLGYSRYTATILGYADSCNFSKEDQKLVYDYFFNKINTLNLTDFQTKELTGQFFETAHSAKDLGVSNSHLTCGKFKNEFDKIVTSTIKK